MFGKIYSTFDSENGTYVGQVITTDDIQIAHGMGILKIKNQIFDCEFVSGIPQGKGSIRTFMNDVKDESNKLYSYYNGYISNYRPHGEGHLVINNENIEYNGMFSNGLYHGNGILKNGNTVTEANFINGIAMGNCKIIKTNSDNSQTIFNGEIKYLNDGTAVPVGHVELITKKYRYRGSLDKNMNPLEGEMIRDNKIFKGKFVNGNLTEGIMIDKGNIYEGSFKQYMKHGFGKFKFTSGIIYEGQFFNDSFKGNPKIIYPNGNYYIGRFPEGYGKMFYHDCIIENVVGRFMCCMPDCLMLPNGYCKSNYNVDGSKIIIEGEYILGKFRGIGKVTYEWGEFEVGDTYEFNQHDCSIYLGDFDDKMNGVGIKWLLTGLKYVGTFTNGELNGKGEVVHKGGVYTGNFKNGSASGYGINTYNNGEIYEGDHKYDKAHGRGLMIFNDGTRYIGDFKNGNVNGHGYIIDANGEAYEGHFDDGVQIGSRKIDLNAIQIEFR